MSVSLDELDSHLFKCADIIRNTVDKTDYKDYILPLVFYKTISDTYNDQYEQRLEEYGDEEIASRDAFYDFVVPEEYSWEKLRSQNKNIDQFINEAFDALSEANEGKLEGVFRADYVAASALTDDKLNTLVEHLSTQNLSIEQVPPDMLGEAYMDLVRHFASEEGRDGGEFFTPPNIVRLMVRLVAPFQDGDTFHDPTCGSGGMLVESAYHYRDEQDGEYDKLTFTGQEMNPDIYAMAKINLFVHGLNGNIQRGDSLGDPQFETDGKLDQFDYVLANFPFSADWPKEDLQDDPWNRFDWHEKLPRTNRGDYAFIMHMASQLNETGQAAIVVPHGVLFRGDEQRYREPMVKSDLVEGVISLPRNMFQNNSIPSAILILNRDKSPTRQEETIFINANDPEFYEELSNQNKLTNDGMTRIVELFNQWESEDRVSRSVSRSEIEDNDYNLNIALYVDTSEKIETESLSKEQEHWQNLRKERDSLEDRLGANLQKLGEISQVSFDNIGTDNPDTLGTDVSHIPEIESIPTEWELETVESLSNQILGGGTPTKSNEEYWEGTIPWASVKDLNGVTLSSTQDYITEKGLESSATNLIQSGSIIISTRMTVGEPFVNFVDMAINQDMKAIIPDNERVNTFYLLYSLWEKDPYLKSLGRGTTVDGITTSDLKRTNIQVPPLTEQRKIASILYNIDLMIEKQEELIGRAGRVSKKDDEIGRLQTLKLSLMENLFSGRIRTKDLDIEIIDTVREHD